MAKPRALHQHREPPVSRPRTSHAIVVAIRTDLAESAADARERLHGWLETYGHTASSHGFTLEETRPVIAAAGKKVSL